MKPLYILVFCFFLSPLIHSRFMLFISLCFHAHAQNISLKFCFLITTRQWIPRTSTPTPVQFYISGDLMRTVEMIVLAVIKDVMPVCLFLVGWGIIALLVDINKWCWLECILLIASMSDMYHVLIFDYETNIRRKGSIMMWDLDPIKWSK